MSRILQSKKNFVSHPFFIKNVGLKRTDISYRGAGKLCVVYETTMELLFFPFFKPIFSYFFDLEIPIFLFFFFEQPCRLTPWYFILYCIALITAVMTRQLTRVCTDVSSFGVINCKIGVLFKNRPTVTKRE